MNIIDNLISHAAITIYLNSPDVNSFIWNRMIEKNSDIQQLSEPSKLSAKHNLRTRTPNQTTQISDAKQLKSPMPNNSDLQC